MMSVAVALSGGIDSLVAAHLLKKSHDKVFGIHFQTGYEKTRHRQSGHNSNPSVAKITEMARQLGIQLYIADCRQAFENHIVKYFAQSYQNGLTPNPCVLCNRDIKFKAVMEFAAQTGATHLATGHYARVVRKKDKLQLLQGADPQKDQSYFLSMLCQDQLARAIFPLGSISKDRVRQIACENSLKPVSCNESQDICFVDHHHYSDFLEKKCGLLFKPGQIIDTEGKHIGTHKGLHRYTIGQRRGIDCPASEPYYVVEINPAQNSLVVGFKNSLYKKQCLIRNVNWLMDKPKGAVSVNVRLRYRHSGAEAEIKPLENNMASIRFKHAQKAITPGQAAVCYIDDMVVAAGWIEK
jgi:tRNA-specific 2-thiouridylase